MTQQSDRQASVRAVTGTGGSYEGDWHALFDSAGIAAGDFNGRMLAWINLKYGVSFTEINGALQYVAAQNSAFNWSSLGSFDPTISTLDLNFAAGRYFKYGSPVVFDPANVSGWSFSRTGVEYAATSSGLLVPFSSGTPAITNLGLQVWQAETELVLINTDLTDSTWTKVNSATVTANAAVAPDGTLTAGKLKRDSAASTFRVQQVITVSSATTYTIPVYAKAGEITWLRISDGNKANGDAWVNLATGAVGTVLGGFASVTTKAATPGWWRIDVTYATTTTSAGLQFWLAPGDNSSSFGGGNTTDGLYLWLPGVRAGAFAGPPIANSSNSASATRGAASASVTKSALPASFAVRFNLAALQTSGFPGIVNLSDGTNNNRVTVYYTGSNGHLGLDIIVGGVTKASLDLGAITANTSYILAARVAVGDLAASLNGAAVVTGSPASLPTITGAALGVSGGFYVDGVIPRYVDFPNALSNAQLQAAPGQY